MTYEPPFQAHSETSRLASEQIKPHVKTLREQVLDAIKEQPMTDEEICARTGLSGNTVRPRRIELLKAGLIVANGHRKTNAGRLATVWVATGPTQLQFI